MQREGLLKGLEALGITYSEDMIDAFEVYLRELLRWNKAYNLTAITDEIDIINKHFLDSLLLINLLPKGSLRLCDVGSGAGFPGLPIAIVRADIEATLIEPTRKRCAFLYHLRQKLGLRGVNIIEKRIGDVRGIAFDIITSRALFDLKGLIEKTEGLLSPEGMFVLSMGPQSIKKMDIDKTRYKYTQKDTYIPNTTIKRMLVVVQKNRSY